MSLSSRTSSSQEASDPKFVSSYHTKSLLFGDGNDKSKMFGILDKFEEDKKKAKEKADSDVLAKEFHTFRETLNNIQQLVTGTERNTAVCQTVLEKCDHFASTLQNNLNSLQSDISQKFGTLLNKVSSQKEMMTGLEERVQMLESLKDSLDCLKTEQGREIKMVEEALKLLNALVSQHLAKPTPERVMDSAIQTSPGLEQPISNILQDSRLEGTRLAFMSHNSGHNQAEVPPHNPSCIIGKRKSVQRGLQWHKKRPLVLSRSKHTVTDENRHPLRSYNKHVPKSSRECLDSQDRLSPHCLKPQNRDIGSVAAGCFITPLSCWSQDSNSSLSHPAIESTLEKLSAETRTGTPAEPEGLWQLFDMDSDSVLGL